MKHQPSAIQYIALLDNRQQMLFNNVPPTTIVHPLLRYLGNLPQHMGHFIYGCDYHAIALGNKLQLGYNLKFFHPDSIEYLPTINKSENDIFVFLMCTENQLNRNLYAKAITHFSQDNTLIIVAAGTKNIGNIPGTVAECAEEVWKWFYDYCHCHYEVNYDQQPYSVPYFRNKSFYDIGKVFTPTRVNTQIFNSMLGNWGYERKYDDEEIGQLSNKSSVMAMMNKHSFDRQQELIDQITNMYAIEHEIVCNIEKIKDYEDQFYPPLIIAAPYNSIEMRKPLDIKSYINEEERLFAEMVNAVMNFDYTKNYTVDVSEKDIPNDNFALYHFVQQHFVLPRLIFFDIVGMLHSSIRFSPYLRLPVLGKNINSELAFVNIKGVKKLTNSKKAKKSIRKVMNNIGSKITELTLSSSCQKMMYKRASQIVAMTDLPIEWTMIDGVPLAFTHDVCRLPETPIPALLSVYEQVIHTPYIIPKNIITKTLVVFGNECDDFVEAQKEVVSLSKKLGFHISTCLSVESFEKAVKEIKPQLLIIDTHGDVDEISHQSFLWLGDERLTGDCIVSKGLSARLVFLSACNTCTTCNTISTIGNAFFEAGAMAVTTSYMPIYIKEATLLYTRLLRLLYEAAETPIHSNWLSFIAHLQRTSYIQALITEGKENNKKEINDEDIKELIKLTADSMIFRNRKQIFKKLNETNLAQRMGVDFNNIVPHYLMYSTLGRADLIRFESYNLNN